MKSLFKVVRQTDPVTINTQNGITDPTDFAFKVYSELLNAFKIID